MAKRGNPNPTGGKPDKLMRDALRIALQREAQDADGKPTRKLSLVATALVERAIGGDVPAIKEIFERIDGKMPVTADINVKRDLTEYTTDELLRALADFGIARPQGSGTEPEQIH